MSAERPRRGPPEPAASGPEPKADGEPAGRIGSFVLLAGGRSRRMGRDKARLELGGKPLLLRLLEVGREACEEGVLVTDEPGRYDDVVARFGEAAGGPAGGAERPGASHGTARAGSWPLRRVTDRRPGQGPLAGLEAGLAAAAHPVCFVASCDLPWLEAPLVRSLIAELRAAAGDDGPPRALVPVRSGRYQPLCAAYESRAAAVATACLDGGERRVDALLGRLRVRELDEAGLDALTGHPGAARWTRDLDTPGDLRAAREDAGEP